jgi:hypothetical protein
MTYHNCIYISWRRSIGPKHVVTKSNKRKDHKTVAVDGVYNKWININKSMEQSYPLKDDGRLACQSSLQH